VKELLAFSCSMITKLVYAMPLDVYASFIFLSEVIVFQYCPTLHLIRLLTNLVQKFNYLLFCPRCRGHFNLSYGKCHN